MCEWNRVVNVEILIVIQSLSPFPLLPWFPMLGFRISGNMGFILFLSCILLLFYLPVTKVFEEQTVVQIFKSGPLFISSKGIGWTSWKKRWFILTRTSLVFFRSDPVSSSFCQIVWLCSFICCFLCDSLLSFKYFEASHNNIARKQWKKYCHYERY